MAAVFDQDRDSGKGKEDALTFLVGSEKYTGKVFSFITEDSTGGALVISIGLESELPSDEKTGGARIGVRKKKTVYIRAEVVNAIE